MKMPTTMSNEGDHPLSGLCEEWLSKIKEAEKVKKVRFQTYADEAMKFYDGAHDFMWREEYAMSEGGFLDKSSVGSGAMPTFRMTVNRVFEAVALFGPALYHQYPNVMVTPIKHPDMPPEVLGLDPMDEIGMQRYQALLYQKQYRDTIRSSHAELAQHYLNWLQVEGGKKSQARRAITEAIVKGLGILWIDIYQPKGSEIKYPRATYVSCDDIVKDQDAEYSEEVQWIARKHVKAVNIVEEEFGLRPGSLKGSHQSKESQATALGKNEAKQNKGFANSYDLIEYWEVYSKNGFGHKLKSTKNSKANTRVNMDFMGDYCRIVVAKNIPYPLNIPTQALTQESEEEIFVRGQWPIPFWTDSSCGNGWPFAELFFYDKPKSVWPISIVKPAIGELRFINWCMSFLADKVAASSTTYVGVMKDAGIEIQNQLQSGLSPYTVLEISNLTGRRLDEVVSFMDSPNFSIDIWKMVAEVLEMIDKRMGLTELLYGLTGAQIRSATEANVRDQNISIRPDDMAQKTEDWLSEISMKEMEAAVWALEGRDVIGPLGEIGAQIWDSQIREKEYESIIRDFDYRIEAGTARKPNKPQRAAALNEFAQVSLPTIQQFALQGIVQPWNALMRDMGKAMDLEVDGYLIELPEPEESGPSEEEIQAQAKMAELEMSLQAKAMDLEHTQEKHDQDMEFDEEKHDQEMRQASEKNALLKRAGYGRNS